MRRRAPRPLGLAVGALRDELAPMSLLAQVQGAWSRAAGEAIAREAQPVSERAGTVTLSCRSAVWAQELDLMAPALVEGLNRALGRDAVRDLRCVTAGGRAR